MSFDPQSNIGLFVPTTNIYEIEQIQEEGFDKERIKNILVHLYQDMCNVAIALNLKDSAYYPLEEFMNGQVYFPNGQTINPNYAGRQVFRKIINFGSLPNATTIAIPHNIQVFNSFSFTRIYGTATNPITMQYIPLPYSSASSVANNIELKVDSTNVYITTGANQSAYTITYVILEYLKE
jgi:hypothetical protein